MNISASQTPGFVFPQFILFLFQDPIQGIVLHLVISLLCLQPFLNLLLFLTDLDGFEEDLHL